jgi:hypothetical protein
MNNINLDYLNDSIPAAPTGMVEISDDFLGDLSGGFWKELWNGTKAVVSWVGTNVVKPIAKSVADAFVKEATRRAEEKIKKW